MIIFRDTLIVVFAFGLLLIVVGLLLTLADHMGSTGQHSGMDFGYEDAPYHPSISDAELERLWNARDIAERYSTGEAIARWFDREESAMADYLNKVGW